MVEAFWGSARGSRAVADGLVGDTFDVNPGLFGEAAEKSTRAACAPRKNTAVNRRFRLRPISNQRPPEILAQRILTASAVARGEL